MELKGCRVIFMTACNRYQEGTIIQINKGQEGVNFNILVNEKVHENVYMTDILNIFAK
jgi:hypothetical protein